MLIKELGELIMFTIRLIDIGVKVVTRNCQVHVEGLHGAEACAARIIADLMEGFDFETRCVANSVYVVTARKVYYGCYTITNDKG